MKKKFYGALLLGSVLLAGGMVSCSDYDDDINSLTQRVDAIEKSVADLKAAIENGKTIKSVTSIENGFEIEFSDGQKYAIKNGENGANGDTWTIGSDGYWYKNGNKTEWKAVGTDGAEGSEGPAGPAGENGQYYVPNAETGCFDIYKDGKKVESTDISWKSGSMTAVFNGTQLTLSGVDLGDGTIGDVTLNVGVQLGSVAFIPEVVSSDVPYPTTTDEFLHLTTYLDESKYDASNTFVPQADFDKSNIIETAYRLNPSNANIQDAVLAFINRQVETRATADNTNLLNCADYTWNEKEGTVSVKTTINASALSEDNKEADIAALQVWAGQHPVTSDFIHVESNPIDVKLADSLKTLEAGNLVEFYPRTKSIAKGESDAFVKQFVSLNAKANFKFSYDESIDLKKYVGLYSPLKKEFLAELGFIGMSYDFTLVSEYKSDDNQKTNQQWYVKETEEGVIKVDESHLTEGLTPAIGKTPVVRVDAYLTSNAGTRRLVASSYIKLQITDISVTPGEDKDPIKADISETKRYEYHALSNKATIVGEMPWQEVNNVIYGKTGLNSQNFWNYYGGSKDQYEVKVTTKQQTTGNEVTIISNTITAGTNWVFGDKGLELEVMINKGETQTSNIKVGVNNEVKTENTYMDVEGQGAEYIVTITIPSDNKEQRGDVVLSQVFYVKEDCKTFTYNPLYLEGENTIVVKGQLNASKTWEMSSVVNEHFERIDGKNIFQYYSEINNIAVNGLSFQWAAGTTGVTPDASVVNTTDFTVALDGAMTESEVIKNMTYKTTLVNGETCNFNYNIKFINPFVATTGKAIEVYGNGIGKNTGDVKTQLLVNDTEGDAIYYWDGTKLTLTSKATNDYKVAAPTVTYEFDKDNADYKTIKANMSANSTLDIDNNGIFTWENEGAKLTRNYTLPIKVTVTFENLSEVVCTIPVVLKAEK